MLFDLQTIGLVLDQLEEEKGLSREVVIEAIEEALSSAYKKEFGKRSQMIRAKFDLESGAVDYVQVKLVVSPEQVIELEDDESMPDQEHLPEEERKIRFNAEQHLYVENARLIKTDAEVGEELIFPLESQTEFSRVAAQAAKQVIMQKIRGAEKEFLREQFGGRVGGIVQGTVERVERGSVFVNMDKAEGIISYHEQIKSERFRTGDRIRAYLFAVDDSGGRGVFLKLSRTHPEFLRKLFVSEVPELGAGTIEIKGIAREPGFRSKVAVWAHDADVDPIGAMVGQNGARVTTVTSELSGERIDIIEWSEDTRDFIVASLSPARVQDISINSEEMTARVEVPEDQYSLAIGRGGQNARLAARLTGYKIDIVQVDVNGKEIITPKNEGDPNKPTPEPAPRELIADELPTEEAEQQVIDATAQALDAPPKESQTEGKEAVDEDRAAIEELVEENLEAEIRAEEETTEQETASEAKTA